MLVLECARRLRQDPAQTVRLATSHRAVRAQPVPKAPGFAQHFRLFCLATAGRERKDHGFVVEHLADPLRRIHVLSGDASRGVAAQFAGDLQALRGNVVMVDGNDVAVRRTVALMEESDVLVTVDLRRYDRWLVEAARTAAQAGVWTVSIADSVLSPVAACSQRTLVVTAAGAGPFDSHVGM